MIPEKVQAILDEHGLSALEFEAGSTPTVASAAERIGVQPGQIAKSMVMKGKDGRFFLLVSAGDRKIISGKLKKLVGVKCSMASAQETYDLTGYQPGGVCPFGVEGIELYLDKSLGDWDLVYPAAGTDASGVPLSLQHLQRITGAELVDVTG